MIIGQSVQGVPDYGYLSDSYNQDISYDQRKESSGLKTRKIPYKQI